MEDRRAVRSGGRPERHQSEGRSQRARTQRRTREEAAPLTLAEAGIEITHVRFIAAQERDVQRGLIGFLAVDLNHAIGLDGITLRRMRNGKPTLSMPSRRDREDRPHPYVLALTDPLRADFEAQVLAELGLS